MTGAFFGGIFCIGARIRTHLDIERLLYERFLLQIIFSKVLTVCIVVLPHSHELDSRQAAQLPGLLLEIFIFIFYFET